MAHRYVLVTDKARFKLDDKFIDQFPLLGKGWLSSNKACEIITKEPIEISANLPIDVFEVDPLDDKRKKTFLFCDMDSTIVAEETLDRLATNLSEDISRKIAEITQQSMEGRVDFKTSLARRVSYLKGLDIELLTKIAHDLPLSPGAATLVKTMKLSGAFCVLISGGFTHITQVLSDKLGFDEHHANNLIVRDNIIQGELSGKIQDGEEKGRIIKRILSRYQRESEHAIAVGDGANDRSMMNQCDMSFAYYGKDVLKEKARYQINHTDLTSLLYAQGFKDSEIHFCDS